MATVTKIFNYTGTIQYLTIPSGTTSVDVYAWGGAGGGGGGDSAGPGRSGAAGHFVKKTSLSLTSYVGKVITVAVGGGGAGGSGGGGASGGSNGKSLTGFSGGNGGSSGPNGSSGAGGGGGGASVVQIHNDHIGIGASPGPVVVAGGGGGGAGDGQHSIGTVGVNANSQVSTGSPASLGEKGANHNGDGGGGGGAGGGNTGGKGGNGGSGDHGGTGGFSGGDLVPAGGTNSVGSGTTPGGTGESHYAAGIAVGGGAGQSGGNGKVVLVFDSTVEAKVKTGASTWKSVTDMYFKFDDGSQNGTWKRITDGYIKTGATEWKSLFNTLQGQGGNFKSNSAQFGGANGGADSSGGAGSSGSAGSGGGGGGRVICTWLQNKGMFSAEDLKIDQEFSVRYLSRTLKIGYWFWGIPLVEYMNNADKKGTWFGKLVIKVIRMLAQARANELAYQMGVRKQGDILGKVTRLIGESFCWCVGFIVRPFVEKRFGDWLQIYDPDID